MARQKSKVPVKRGKAAKKEKAAAKSSAKQAQSLAPLASLREEIDNLFERFAEDWPSLPRLLSQGWSYPFGDLERRSSFPILELNPRADVSETDEAYNIALELPGMTDKDIELHVSDDSLTVKGEKKSEREEERKNYHISERSYGSFQRTFRVPSGVDQDRIEASCAKGVLNISLPKTAAAKEKKRTVEVKGA